MFLDRAIQKVRLFPQTRARPAPVAQEVVKPVEEVEQIVEKAVVPTPWEALKTLDKETVQNIRATFLPRELHDGGLDLLQLPDQTQKWRFFNKSKVGEMGIKESSFWLDPKKWKDTLDSFSRFASSMGGKYVYLEVLDHQTPTEGGPEWVIISPVVPKKDAHLRGLGSFYLTADGNLTFLVQKNGYGKDTSLGCFKLGQSHK